VFTAADEDNQPALVTEMNQCFRATTFDQTVTRILDLINYKVDENKD